MEDILSTIIDTSANSFDFSFCIVSNILTYLVIKFIDEINGNKPITTWQKRIIMVCCIIVLAIIKLSFGNDTNLILNSAILSPVFWSWIGKPIVKKFNIDYNK